ncbi:MAG TPA: CPBP family intramembrane metalloprotease [Bacteroidales bacterium]|nr:CPBP family intramembrane metalloprotease [Bacteroidales bacterium]
MRLLLTNASPGFKIAYLFIFLLIGLFVAGVVSNLLFLIPLFNSDSVLVSVYVNTVTQSVFAIAIPAILIVAWTNSKPLQYLKIQNEKSISKKIVFTVLVFIFSYIFASFLSVWNEGIILPEWLSEVEKVMRTMEDAALETTSLLLSGKTVGSLILNIAVIAALASISEELFFRGAMQQFIQEKFKNGHLSVWLTALIFSIVHFQFYGFFPRLFLGAVLGYLFLYTRNLWIPILLHFLNNATVIIVDFFWSDTDWYNRIEGVTISYTFILLALVSILATIFLFVIYNKRASKNYNYDTDSTDINI